MCGIDWEGPPPLDDDTTVIVPETRCPLSTRQLAELQSLYDPLNNDACHDYGISLYLDVVEFVRSCTA